MSPFGPKVVASLELGFPERSQVQLLNQSVLATVSNPPAPVVYPLMMAGKLFYNFGDARARGLAQAGAVEIQRRLDAAEGRPSLLSVFTGGEPAWDQGAPARLTYRADFVEIVGAPVLVPQTHFPPNDEDYYHCFAIGACMDLASHLAGERGREVAEATARLLQVISVQGVASPQAPVMAAYGAAAAVYGTR